MMVMMEVGTIVFILGIKLMIKVVHAEETAEDAGALLHPSEVSTKQ